MLYTAGGVKIGPPTRLLFELQACLDFYHLYEGKIKECDQVIEKFWSSMRP